MSKFVCTVCGFVYDESAGIPGNGIAPGTKWGSLQDDWACPICGATKAEFEEQITDKKPSADAQKSPQLHGDNLHELSFGELSALCTNFSKGCEKQYRPEEAGLFSKLADYYKSKSRPQETKSLDDLLTLVQQDLGTDYPMANSVATGQADRGALRALVWGEKVTRILSSLLNRYEKQRDVLLENTNVFVCEICGFVYIGNHPPEICPVCKVPNSKIRLIEKEAV